MKPKTEIIEDLGGYIDESLSNSYGHFSLAEVALNKGKPDEAIAFLASMESEMERALTIYRAVRTIYDMPDGDRGAP